ncbi:cupin domain-containing protein [Oceanobacter sp. 3_MG-2023]|uniref:cupin domain-containing protein n=1 Tax=Oceanobacter sp. 3_MG-2023 TaxID=3062622 RepID=UPI0027340CE0|nr:cupin domain-containing protein [Oceanobacter sp. 3_MG-2023]MDP2506633.1 cupin domain-containing protein [Oceanobacter sp. 3_MG-2023]
MKINSNFTVPIHVQLADLDWISSPTAGVDRKMIYREGDEVARATSIVRYAPGSTFPAHTHAGGEEILVLDGVFQDEHGDYPKGSYLRNPPGSRHRPAALSGCTIFVKLWQFRADDQAQIAAIATHPQRTIASIKNGNDSIHHPTADAETLFSDGHEIVTLEHYSPESAINIANARGLEILILSGAIKVDHHTLEPLSWIRLPAGTALQGTAGSSGTRFWMKQAPLQHPDICDIASYLQQGQHPS